MTYGDRLRFIRRFRGMTQAELGAACDFGKNGHIYIAMYENGSRIPKKERNECIAKALGISPKILMWENNEPNEDIAFQLCWAFILPVVDYPLYVTDEILTVLQRFLDDYKKELQGELSKREYVDKKIQLMNDM